MPILETTPEVCAFYNKANLEGFKKVGYFILQDVIVCETGNADKVRELLSRELNNFVQVTPPAGLVAKPAN